MGAPIFIFPEWNGQNSFWSWLRMQFCHIGVPLTGYVQQDHPHIPMGPPETTMQIMTRQWNWTESQLPVEVMEQMMNPDSWTVSVRSQWLFQIIRPLWTCVSDTLLEGPVDNTYGCKEPSESPFNCSQWRSTDFACFRPVWTWRYASEAGIRQALPIHQIQSVQRDLSGWVQEPPHTHTSFVKRSGMSKEQYIFPDTSQNQMLHPVSSSLC